MSDQADFVRGGLGNQQPREFQPVENVTERAELIREGARTLASAMIWTKDQSQVIQTHLVITRDERSEFVAWLPKEFDIKDLRTDCFFSVSLARANIFFKAPFVGTDETGLVFRYPQEIFRVQRRSDLRFVIPEGHVLRASFEDPLFPEKEMTRKVIDISAGGMGLLLEEGDSSVLLPELEVKKLRFALKSKPIQCDAEIRYVRPLPPTEREVGMKAGIKFTGLKPADAAYIASYVFEESRKYYLKFL